MKRLKADKRREQLLDTAAVVFATRGYARSTTAQVPKPRSSQCPRYIAIWRQASAREMGVPEAFRNFMTMGSAQSSA